MGSEKLKAHVYESLFNVLPTKSQQQQLSIMEAAVRSFAANGIQGTTYASLAKDCEISRPLIHHYYPEYNDLVRQSASYVRAVMRAHSEESLNSAGGSATLQLKAFIHSYFTWIDRYPNHYKFWLLFLYMTSVDKKSRTENTKLQSLGQEKIELIIKSGIEDENWKPLFSAKQTAKMIQAMIIGSMAISVTEDSDVDTSDASSMLWKTVISLLNSK